MRICSHFSFVWILTERSTVTVTGVLPCTKPIDYRYTAPTPYWPLGFLNFDIDFLIVETSYLYFYGEFCYLVKILTFIRCFQQGEDAC